LTDYAHFTSPIRRYPDLLVHRAVRHVLQTGGNAGYLYDHNEMVELGEVCSRFERRAELATRDAEDWLKCEYLQKHVGKQYQGLVTSVTSFGMFVQLEELMIDGLVHVTSLKRDYYQFDSVHHRLIGERSGRIYQLGDQVTVEVARVDMEDRKIDFDLIKSTSARFTEESETSRKMETRKKVDRRDYPKGKKARGKAKSKSRNAPRSSSKKGGRNKR
jgi:ribonuclease R